MAILRGQLCILRPFRPGDEADVQRNADDPEVARNLADRFPSPYTLRDAAEWVTSCQDGPAAHTVFAIEVDGAVAGGIGYEVIDSVHPRTAMVGYWLGRAHWGRGIATEALGLLTARAFDEGHIDRLEAGVFPWNRASKRVLEKAGYRLEATLKGRLYKDGTIHDEPLYVRLRGEP